MSDRPSAVQTSYQHEAAGGGYFAPLASAKYLLLITFKPTGTPVYVSVQGMVDGNRAYFRAWGHSGLVKRLRHTDAVQVAPCTVLGLCSFGQPLDATARLLSEKEASQVAPKLAGRYPAQHRFLIPFLARTGRWRMVYYELMA
jgi:PPOX class probable F420-dependent enzyme